MTTTKKKEGAATYAPGVPALLMAVPLVVVTVLALTWALVWTGPLREWLSGVKPLVPVADAPIWWGPLWGRIVVPMVAVILCGALWRPQWRAVQTWRLRRHLADVLPHIGIQVGGEPPRVVKVLYGETGRTIVFDCSRGHSVRIFERHREELAASLGLSREVVNVRQDGQRILVGLMEQPAFTQVER